MTRTLDGLESALAVLELSSPPYYCVAYLLKVGRYRHNRCRYDIATADIDIFDPKYQRYRCRYPLLQRSLAYSYTPCLKKLCIFVSVKTSSNFQQL